MGCKRTTPFQAAVMELSAAPPLPHNDRSVAASGCRERKGQVTQGHRGTFGDYGYVHYLDWSESFMSVNIC